MDGSDRQQKPGREARAARVERLREAVAEGTYQAEPDRIAEALVKRLRPKN